MAPTGRVISAGLERKYYPVANPDRYTISEGAPVVWQYFMQYHSESTPAKLLENMV